MAATAKSKKPATPATRRRRAAPAAKPAPAPAPARSSRVLGVFSIGALAIAAGAVLFEGFRRFGRPGDAEHAAPDLALDAPRPGSDGARAPVDFRPDPTAPIPANERDAFRPALVS